jgi:anaerobic dimethyl sulfoxide reductase subunit C (anchor subunit)
MPETFLILLGAGVMLTCAASDPKAVILRWLRLGGIIALCMSALAGFFLWRRDVVPAHSIALLAGAIVLILGQLAFVQVAHRQTQRLLSAAAAAVGVAAGVVLLRSVLDPRAAAAPVWLLGIGALLAAGASGLSLMDMLLGHAYLNAAQMTMAPFRRLNLLLAATLALRGVMSIVVAPILQARHPLAMFWNLFGLYIGTRWLVGLLVPGVFVWMAHDCIRRRATQSATGILYVAAVLIFVGEMIGLYLMSETGLPL